MGSIQQVNKYLENVVSFPRETNLASYSSLGLFLDLTPAGQQASKEQRPILSSTDA